MPERDRWRRQGWQRSGWEGRRPPWWPENEPWPPTPGGEAWRAARRRFLWRVAIFFVVFVVIAVTAALLLFSLIAGALGILDPGGPGPGPGDPPGRGGGRPGFLILAVALFVILLAVSARAVRRAAAPLGDLVEAAGRVEAGDYTARVAPRGPREARVLAGAFNAMSARLEETEEQRRRLLADLSHELRTPLTVIQGNLEALLDGVYPADREHVKPILEETRLLGRLIDDLRTLALAEAGALRLHREPTDPARLLRDVAASFRPQADEAGVAIEVSAPLDLPAVDVDPVRVREVLEILLSNALRYTERAGSVRILAAAERAPEGGAPASVAITVTDSGAGMPQEELPRIFDRFYRSPDSPGSGLGLSIARNLVEAHGGEISASSVLGEGTSIRFTLPVAPVP